MLWYSRRMRGPDDEFPTDQRIATKNLTKGDMSDLISELVNIQRAAQEAGLGNNVNPVTERQRVCLLQFKQDPESADWPKNYKQASKLLTKLFAAKNDPEQSPPTKAQLARLRFLGYNGENPKTRAEAVALTNQCNTEEIQKKMHKRMMAALFATKDEKDEPSDKGEPSGAGPSGAAADKGGPSGVNVVRVDDNLEDSSDESEPEPKKAAKRRPAKRRL